MPLSNKNINRIWGKRLQDLRQKKSLSRQDVAKFLHLSVQQIRKYETGESALSLYRLQQFADLLKYPLPLLLSFITKSQDYPSLSAEEDELIHLFRQFPSDARQALLNLVQKSLSLKQ